MVSSHADKINLVFPCNKRVTFFAKHCSGQRFPASNHMFKVKLTIETLEQGVKYVQVNNKEPE